MTGSASLDEHGERDKWSRGGVYDAAGALDLEATQELLRERFEPFSERLPNTVGNFSRVGARNDYSAKYESTTPYENESGIEVVRCIVRIFPQGPFLNRWTVEIREKNEQYSTNEHNGWGSWLHADAQRLDSIGSAVATALAVMRQEIPLWG